MYYPYLRAKQFELILLKELVSEGVLKDVTLPVLEPINGISRDLKSAEKFFKENDFHPYLIINPKFGELKEGVLTDFLGYYWRDNNSTFWPAFIYENNDRFILNSIEEYDLDNVMLILLDNFSDTTHLRELCENTSISHIMLLNPENNSSLSEFIKQTNKIFIRLDDMFQKLVRNADYLPVQARKYTEHHINYEEKGFDGFSDFTVLPKSLNDGRGRPYAIVIHFTYIGVNDEVWIRHFTSESNESEENPQGKFAEAASKATSFCEQNNLSNSAIIILNDYFFIRKSLPALGVIKKISIKNHLIVVSDYLRSLKVD